MRLKVVYTPESVASQPEDSNEIVTTRKASRAIDFNNEIKQEQKITTKQIRRE